MTKMLDLLLHLYQQNASGHNSIGGLLFICCRVLFHVSFPNPKNVEIRIVIILCNALHSWFSKIAAHRRQLFVLLSARFQSNHSQQTSNNSLVEFVRESLPSVQHGWQWR
jgi:hypothetical protein